MNLDRLLRSLRRRSPPPVPARAWPSRPPERPARPLRIVRLALIWPYDAAGGIVAGILPLADGEARDVAVTGYRIVTSVSSHPPYTHIVAVGRQDYLAELSSRPAALAFNGAATHGTEAFAARGVPGSPPESPARQAGAVVVGTIVAEVDGAAAECRAEEDWEAEGGALAGNRHRRPAPAGAASRGAGSSTMAPIRVDRKSPS
jgi:hypothetical protein